MNRNATPAQPIHALHVERFSPYNFDPSQDVAADIVFGYYRLASGNNHS